MPTAHLIHGFLGAGKTTFARQLEQRIPAIRFSHDEWMARLYGVDPPVERFEELYQRVWVQMEEVWRRCLDLSLTWCSTSAFGHAGSAMWRGQRSLRSCAGAPLPPDMPGGGVVATYRETQQRSQGQPFYR